MKRSDLVPPIVMRAAKRLLRPTPPASRLASVPKRATFSTYEDAMKECGAHGYETDALVEVVFRKTVAFRDALRDFPLEMSASDTLALFALGLALRGTAPITVLDFGGACGAHYFRMRALFGPDVRLRWQVVETPAMARRAGALQTNELSFSDSLAEAGKSLGRIDIVYSSGTLQCVPNPHETLRQLISCRAPCLVLPRLGLSETAADVITVHEARLSDNGPGPLPVGMPDGTTRYPFTFPARHAIEASLMKDYEVILRVPDPSGVYPVNEEPLAGAGYVAQAKNPDLRT